VFTFSTNIPFLGAPQVLFSLHDELSFGDGCRGVRVITEIRFSEQFELLRRPNNEGFPEVGVP
jgi:hypothetical protein